MRKWWPSMVSFIWLLLLGHPESASATQTLVPAPQYAVATANPYATNAGMKVLKEGGTAVDAAVAIQMVLGVVEPQSSGLGGGAMALYSSSADHSLIAFDGVSESPKSYDPAARNVRGFVHSGAAVGTPGSLKMLWQMHQQYGKLPWSSLFQSAIELADKGFVVSPYLARSIAAAAKKGMIVPSWLRHSDGRLIVRGDLVKNIQLADTLRRIARGGQSAFYVDDAILISNAVQHAPEPGQLSVADINSYQIKTRKALCLAFHQTTICSVPPPSYGGVTVLEMLGMLEDIHPASFSFNNISDVQSFIEAGRLAEADRMALIGDPDASKIEAAALLDSKYLRDRAALIKSDSSLPNPVVAGAPPMSSPPNCKPNEFAPPPSTSQISIVDSSGNALAMTTTINLNFGSWVTVGGFFLNDAMINFARPQNGTCLPNAPEGSKRPATAIAPVIEFAPDGSVLLVGGSAGAGEIVDYVSQAVLELQAGGTPADALDDGHISTARAPYPESPGLVQLERARAVAQFAPALTSLGHKISITPLESGTAFIVRRNGAWVGAADPRRDGTFASNEGGHD